MDGRFDNKSIGSPVVSNDKEHKNPKQVVLHQNICSLRKNNRIGSSVMLRIKACRCNMPHRTLAQLSEICTNIVDFKLVSAFHRSSSEHVGSGTYVKDGLRTRLDRC
jgi:hypothetical protein